MAGRVSLKNVSNRQLIAELQARLAEMREIESLLSGSTVAVSRPAERGTHKLSDADRKARYGPGSTWYKARYGSKRKAKKAGRAKTSKAPAAQTATV